MEEEKRGNEKFKFLELEYQTLRKEIEEANSRAFKLMVGGAGLPALQSLAKTYDLDIFMLGIPCIIVVITLLFLGQHLAIMRCGRYIREEIEPSVHVAGWEAWLELDKSKTRFYNKVIVYSFFALSCVYYIFSGLLAGINAPDLLADLLAGKEPLDPDNYDYLKYVVWGVYLLVAIAIGGFITRNARYSISTDPEQEL